jgi:hypothetical protein
MVDSEMVKRETLAEHANTPTSSTVGRKDRSTPKDFPYQVGEIVDVRDTFLSFILFASKSAWTLLCKMPTIGSPILQVKKDTPIWYTSRVVSSGIISDSMTRDLSEDGNLRNTIDPKILLSRKDWKS